MFFPFSESFPKATGSCDSTPIPGPQHGAAGLPASGREARLKGIPKGRRAEEIWLDGQVILRRTPDSGLE